MENAKQFKTEDYINAIRVAVKLSDNFVEYSEEKWSYMDNFELENGILKKLVIGNKYYKDEREVRNGKLIFRFYEDRTGKLIRMSVCDYVVGLLSEDFDESMDILAKYI